MNKFYSAGQLAQSGLLPYRSKDTIVKLIKAGRLRAYIGGKKTGKRYIIPESAVIEYLNKEMGNEVSRRM